MPRLNSLHSLIPVGVADTTTALIVVTITTPCI